MRETVVYEEKKKGTYSVLGSLDRGHWTEYTCDKR